MKVSLRETLVALRAWYQHEQEIVEPTTNLLEPFSLDVNGFIAAIRTAKGRRTKLTVAALEAIQREYEATVAPARVLLAEAERLEIQLSALVNAAYGLTSEEVALMWRTAPPRMPIAPPAGAG